MSKAAKKIDNQEFISITTFLMEVKKLTLEDLAIKLNIDRLKIANIRGGRSSANKMILADIKEAYRAELMHFDASLNYSADFTMNDLLERLKALEAGQAGKLDKSEFEEVRNLVIRMAAKVLG